jgi:hypothetical protein
MGKSRSEGKGGLTSSNIVGYSVDENTKQTYTFMSDRDILIEKDGKICGVLKGKQTAINEKINVLGSDKAVGLYYVNAEVIRDQYAAHITTESVMEITKERVSNGKAALGGSLPPFAQSSTERADSSREIAIARSRDLPVEAMVQKILVKRMALGELALDVEFLDVEREKIEHFEDLVHTLTSVYAVQVDTNSVEQARRVIHDAMVKRKLESMAALRGATVIQGAFRVKQSAEGIYQFQMRHPVSDYLGASEQPITIMFIVNARTVQDTLANYFARSDGKEIPLTIYGKIWKTANGRDQNGIEIIPYAVW